jgi:hypothetical protein
LQFGELHFAKSEEDMVLAGEIIKESSFADVGGVGDVFNGGFGETFFGEESEGRAEEPFTKLSAAAGAPVGVGGRKSGRHDMTYIHT